MENHLRIFAILVSYFSVKIFVFKCLYFSNQVLNCPDVPEAQQQTIVSVIVKDSETLCLTNRKKKCCLAGLKRLNCSRYFWVFNRSQCSDISDKTDRLFWYQLLVIQSPHLTTTPLRRPRCTRPHGHLFGATKALSKSFSYFKFSLIKPLFLLRPGK